MALGLRAVLRLFCSTLHGADEVSASFERLALGSVFELFLIGGISQTEEWSLRTGLQFCGGALHKCLCTCSVDDLRKTLSRQEAQQRRPSMRLV